MPLIFGKLESSMDFSSFLGFLGNVLFVQIYINSDLNKMILIRKVTANNSFSKLRHKVQKLKAWNFLFSGGH